MTTEAGTKRTLACPGGVFGLLLVLTLLALAVQLASAETVSAVSTGSGPTCAVTTAGGLKCWGLNDLGQVGDGTTTDRLTLVDVCADAVCTSFLSGVAAVSVGSQHTCALTTAGAVKCWGDNRSSQLGDGTRTVRTSPVDVCADAACTSFLSGVAGVSAGAFHTCAVTAAGGVKCWGVNSARQLGDGTTTSRSTPVDVCADAACSGSLAGVIAVSAGGRHTCALTTVGGVKCWGDNSKGVLGNGTTTGGATPVDVCADAACSGSLAGVIAVSAGSAHTCVLTTAGGLKCWGLNGSGRLGDGSNLTRTTPVDVCADAACSSFLSGMADVAAGFIHTCAVTTAGGVKCWGSDFQGALGAGGLGSRSTPVDVCADAACSGSLAGVIAVSAGSHTCAVTTVGGLKCWGLNSSGQLGDGTTTSRFTPVDVVSQTISSDVSDNLEVGASDTVLITAGATLSGNLEVDGGTVIIDNGATVAGNLESMNGGTVTLSDGATLEGNLGVDGGALEITGGSTVSGNLEVQDATTVTVTDSVIDGNVLTQNNQSVTIVNSTIQGNIESTDDGTVTISDNTVTGNLEINNPTSCTESNNTVNGTNSGCP